MQIDAFLSRVDLDSDGHVSVDELTKALREDADEHDGTKEARPPAAERRRRHHGAQELPRAGEEVCGPRASATSHMKAAKIMRPTPKHWQ